MVVTVRDSVSSGDAGEVNAAQHKLQVCQAHVLPMLRPKPLHLTNKGKGHVRSHAGIGLQVCFETVACLRVFGADKV